MSEKKTLYPTPDEEYGKEEKELVNMTEHFEPESDRVLNRKLEELKNVSEKKTLNEIEFIEIQCWTHDCPNKSVREVRKAVFVDGLVAEVKMRREKRSRKFAFIGGIGLDRITPSKDALEELDWVLGLLGVQKK